jgi:drug/metabolite transporter (DMT)-like permease
VKKSIFENNLYTFIFATISCLLWGSAFPAIKTSYSLLGIGSAPYQYKILFAGYRFMISGILIFIFMIINREKINLTKTGFKHLILLSFLQTSLHYTFFYIGLSNTTGIKSAIITAFGTFLSILFAHFYYANDKMSRNTVSGLLFGFAGVILINLGSGSSIGGGFKFTGEGFLLITATLSAIAGIYAKEISRHVSPLLMTASQLFIGSLFLIGYGGMSVGFNSLNFNTTSFSLLIYLGTISAVAFSLWFTLIKYNPISKISIFKFQIPVWGTILSAMFLPGENLTYKIVISLILVSTGIIFVNRKKN